MTINELQSLFDSKNRIKFKLYSLEYSIEKVDNYVEAYAIDYPTKKMKYTSFKEAMQNFKVYNESLTEQIDRIRIID